MTDLRLEKEYFPLIVAGVDEAGRGPLAGPVCAGVVVINSNHVIPGIKDSKQIPESRRERLYEEIVSNYTYAAAFASAQEIDSINILEATKLAIDRAIKDLPKIPDVVLIDGNMKFYKQNYHSIVKGDTLSTSIAAASIVAKVTRDRLMRELALKFPEYLWQNNKAYGTKEHIEAIKKYGLSPHHRRTFMKNLHSGSDSAIF